MFKTLSGRGYKSRLVSLGDEYWDRRLGVETFGYHPGSQTAGSDDLRVHYTPAPYSDIFSFLRLVNLSDTDVFADFGGGLGRAVFAASWLGAKRCIGVEIVPALCRNASRNADREVEFVCDSADSFWPTEATVLFMFHPFGEKTLRRVLQNIERDRGASPRRELRIIYMNPVYDHVLEQANWLEQISRTRGPRRWLSSAGKYEASIWRTC
jgi:hypothetical protein